MTETDDEPLAQRLMVDGALAAGGILVLDPDQSHYVRTVLRLGPGAGLALFNGRDGEWAGTIETVAKSGVRLRLDHQRRAQTAEPPLTLYFAPVKRARIDLIVEKATELGATRLVPVMTRYTQMSRVNLARLGAITREAAEQSGRLGAPVILAPAPLFTALAAHPPTEPLIWADESGLAPALAPVLAPAKTRPGRTGWAALIGPEGGFAPEERDQLRALPFVCAVGLGPRILRADTAALAVLASLQSHVGDWT